MKMKTATSFTRIPPTRAGSTFWLGLTTSLILFRKDATKILTRRWIGSGGTTNIDSTSMTTEHNLAEGVVVERPFKAPVTRVWKALTDANEMRQWYFDLKEFKPEVGFEFEFVVEHEGMTYHHLCKVTKVIPQKALAYTWRYQGHKGDSLVTFELFADGDKTRLKLTHEDLETFPKTPSFARKNFMEGWTQIIGSSLKEFLEGDVVDKK